jgi:hypothetical protein
LAVSIDSVCSRSGDPIVSCFSIDRLIDGDAIAIAVAITPIPTIQAIKKIEVESQRFAIAIDFSVKDQIINITKIGDDFNCKRLNLQPNV